MTWTRGQWEESHARIVATLRSRGLRLCGYCLVYVRGDACHWCGKSDALTEPRKDFA